MQLSMRQILRPEQKLSLTQIIQTANFLSVPDEVLNVVACAMSYNPDSIEAILEKQKKEKPAEYAGVNKAQTLYSSITPSKGDPNNKGKGIILVPDMRILEKCDGAYQTIVTPDVTYIGRRDNKPEIVFSDHLKGSVNLMLEIDSSKYPETSKLLYQLRHFDTWKRSKLRDAYVLLGGKQSEFLEDFDKARCNVYIQRHLGNDLSLDESTVSRILCNRWVEARNIAGEQKLLFAKDLFVSKDHLKKYLVLPILNKILEEEFERKIAYSDEEITSKETHIARRTIVKYRGMSSIPNTSIRNREYKSNTREEPYKFV